MRQGLPSAAPYLPRMRAADRRDMPQWLRASGARVPSPSRGLDETLE